MRQFGKGFPYKQIEGNLLRPPFDVQPDECEQICANDEKCVGWEVCAPLGEGCEGCYLVKNRPEIIERTGWTAGLIDERAANMTEGLGEVKMPENLEGCYEFLLKANGGDPNSEFHKGGNLKIYNDCGDWVRQTALPKNITVLGQHWPTSLIMNFRDPTISLPHEVEQELTGATIPENAYYNPGGPGSVTDELHATSNTNVLPPTKNHAFVLPFYDTNIGHWIKEYGSMNVLQSYEMQSILRPGDVVIDVGANLGSFTIPFAERVGRQGKVLAFEPFRWLFQLLTANVALNGLSNVWTFNLALGENMASFESRPPQLRFFSSPGGVKAREQDKDAKLETQIQLYDFEVEPETVMMASLDMLLSGQYIKTPPIQDVRLVKIDVEGMESAVIIGMQGMIQTFKPIIWSENVDYFDKGDTQFIEIMAQLKYVCGKAQNAPNDLICTHQDGEGHQVQLGGR